MLRIRANGPPQEKKHHHEATARKEEALRNYEHILTKAYRQISIDYEKAEASWPNLFDRFKSIGKETDYRTVYAALCSQAHNDAEDLLNKFVAGVVQNKGMKERQERENISFALLMIFISVVTLIESAAMYLAKYSLGPGETLMPLWEDMQRVTHRVASRPELAGRN